MQKYQKQREDTFITLEQTRNLSAIIKEKETYLIDCVSMWIFNHLESSEEEILSELEKMARKEANIIFVLNEVTSGVIPLDKHSRKFVDLTGIVGQKLATICDEVYEVKFGLTHRLK